MFAVPPFGDILARRPGRSLLYRESVANDSGKSAQQHAVAGYGTNRTLPVVLLGQFFEPVSEDHKEAF